MPARDAKRSCYRINDPFLAFFYQYVAPNRSRLGAGQLALVEIERYDGPLFPIGAFDPPDEAKI